MVKKLTFNKEITITITEQAQKIIGISKCSIEEFKEWAFNNRGISLGGGDATHFLEFKYNEGIKEKPDH